MGKQIRTPMQRRTFKVNRVVTLDEVQLDNGAIRYNVQLADEGRKPFISQWFNDPVPASDFFEGLIPQQEV